MQLSKIALSLALLPPMIIATTKGKYQGWHDGSYRFYRGDGSLISGWPAMNEWLDFNTFWDMNEPILLKACSNVNASVMDNDPSLEIPLIKLAIEMTAIDTNLDPRFILAIILQESEGCVRVHTTISPGDSSIFNPGLMQTHEGKHSCNHVDGNPVTPCPWDQIYGMVQDGAAGTAAGDGLAACINEAIAPRPANSTNAPPPKLEAQAYYMAARLYNSGEIVPSGNLDDAGPATGCYCSDVANRLMGWTAADPKSTSTCCLDKTCRVNSTSTSKRALAVPRRVA